MIIIGIDPGASGAIVATDSYGSVTIFKMPATELDILKALESIRASVAFIEWIHPSIQGIGKSQMSKLYGNYCALRMAILASGLRLEEVRAAVWQASLGVTKRGESENRTKWKNRLKARAQELFPGIDVTLWNCDALLIAEYGRRLRTGERTNETGGGA